MDIADTMDAARRAFELAGRGCLVRIGEDEPRYVTVAMGLTVARNRHGLE